MLSTICILVSSQLSLQAPSQCSRVPSSFQIGEFHICINGKTRQILSYLALFIWSCWRGLHTWWNKTGNKVMPLCEYAVSLRNRSRVEEKLLKIPSTFYSSRVWLAWLVLVRQPCFIISIKCNSFLANLNVFQSKIPNELPIVAWGHASLIKLDN